MNNDEVKIKNLLAEHAEAIHGKNVSEALKLYDAQVISYDVAPPLFLSSQDVLNPENTREWFDSWVGNIGYDLRDLTVKVTDESAVAFGLVHLTGKRTSGEEINMWMRLSAFLEKIEGAWKIIHEHTSFPTMMDGSYRSATNLSP